MPIRQKHILPFGINADWFSLQIFTPTIPDVENPTQNCVWDAYRDGVNSMFRCYYEGAQKKIYVNDVVNNVELDDIRIGLSSLYNSIGFQMSILDENIAYVNFDGTPDSNFPIGDENTVYGQTKVYAKEDFYNILADAGNQKAVSFIKEFSQAASTYTGDYEVCKSLDFRFTRETSFLMYSIVLANDVRFEFSVDYMEPITIGNIAYDKRLRIEENGVVSTVLLTSNIGFEPYQRSNYESEKAVDNSLIWQTPQPAGVMSQEQGVFYPNVYYDGIAIELLSDATQIAINDVVYTTPFFTGVSINEAVVARDANFNKRMEAKKINKNSNVCPQMAFEIISDKKLKDAAKKYSKSKREVSGLAKACRKFSKK